MFRAATLSKRSFIEEAVKCLLRVLINAGHSIRMCLTESGPSCKTGGQHSQIFLDHRDFVHVVSPKATKYGAVTHLREGHVLLAPDPMGTRGGTNFVSSLLTLAEPSDALLANLTR